MATLESSFGLEQAAEGGRLTPIIDDLALDGLDRFYANYQLPDYGGREVELVSELGTSVVRDEFGLMISDQLSMNDGQGTRYDVKRCYSAEPKTDIWVIRDTALGTQVDGLNSHVARKLMAAGFNVLIKGPEINSSLAQSESAYNTHQLLDHYEALDLLSAGNIAIEGYSRGAMIGFGTIGYASSFNRKVIYSSLNDPCMATQLGLNKATFDKLRQLPLDTASFTLAILKSFIDFRRHGQLLGTVNPTPAGSQQFRKNLMPLLNGEAGQMAAKLPNDTWASVTFYLDCGFNDAQTYRKLLPVERFPNIYFIDHQGSHLDAITDKAIDAMVVNFVRLADVLKRGPKPEAIDQSYVMSGEYRPKLSVITA